MNEPLVAEPIRLNYRDYCALPEDGKRYEILDGELYMSPSPFTTHQRVLFRLSRALSDHVEREGLGEVFIAPLDVILGESDIVQPDIVFVTEANRSIITGKHIRGVPDLLIEIVSTSRPEFDTRQKRAVYSRCGVPAYWIVEPAAKRLTELHLVDQAYAVVSEPAGNDAFAPRIFPGFSIPLERIWA